MSEITTCASSSYTSSATSCSSRNLDEALPRLIDEVQDQDFQKGLQRHLVQTRRHVSNVEKVFKAMGEPAEAEECVGFEGLKSEHEQLVKESSPELVDLVDLGAAARTEHYEIAAYEGLMRMARALGETDEERRSSRT